MSVERLFKTVHSWLGVMILPWVLIIGVTGIYMNHRDLVLDLLPATDVGPASFETGAGPGPGDSAERAAVLAARLMPGQDLTPVSDDRFLKRPVHSFQGPGVMVHIDRETGHGWLDSRYLRRLYAPDGDRLATSVKWSRVLSSLHQRGWVGTSLGTWLADIAAAALVVFAATGLTLFTLPRLRRAKNRRARLRQARAVG